LKIAAVMRPCEVRATNELTKLEQTNLENITLISFDCPGVMPLSDFVNNPEQGMKHFDQAQQQWDDSIMRPVCQICEHSSMTAGDLHIGVHGANQGTCFLIPTSEKGTEVLQHLGFKAETRVDAWTQKVQKRSQEKMQKRKKAHQALHTQINGLNKFTDAFQQCINCHNCMRVCPVCYCRLCYFDSDKVKQQAEEYLDQATSKGSIRFLPDTTLFHIGRMTHMSLSCVSCGSCEDACPMSIPVAQIFSMIADETQAVFDYVSGKSIDEPLPLRTFKEDELHDMEDAHD